jgi:mannosyltransferase
MAKHENTTSWTAMLIAIVLLGLGLRIVALDTKSVFADESASFRFTHLNWSAFWHLLTDSEANMALYYVFLRFWLRINDSVWFARLFSVLVGVATVPVLFFLGRRLFSREAAFFSSVLLALNTFHILYSQSARGYTLAVLLVTLSALCFVQALEEFNWRSAGGYIVTSTAALYAHFFTAFVFLGQVLGLFFLKSQPKVIKRQAGLMLLVALLGMPLVIFATVHKTKPLFWLDHPSARDVHHLFMYFFGSGLKYALSLVALGFAAREWWRGSSSSTEQHQESNWPFIFVALWLVLPIMLTLIISHWKPVFSPRFLMVCLPSVALLVGKGLSSVRQPFRRYALAAVLFTSLITALPSYYRRPGLEDWRSVTNYLSDNVQPTDVILVGPYYRDAFETAFRRSKRIWPTQKVMHALVGRNLLQDVEHIWIVSCHPSNKGQDDIPATPGNFLLHSDAKFVGIEVFRYDRESQSTSLRN